MRIALVLASFVMLTLATGRVNARPQPCTPQLISINAMTLSPDGKMIAIGDGYGTVQLLDAKTGRGTGLFLTRAPGEVTPSVHSLAFSADSKRVACYDTNGVITIWNAVKGGAAELKIKTRQFDKAQRLAADHNELRFSQDGKSLLAVGHDGSLRQWDALTGQRIEAIHIGDERYHRAVAIARNGAFAVTAHEYAAIHLWQLEPRPNLKVIRLAKDTAIASIAFSPKGMQFATLTSDGEAAKAKVWDSLTGQPGREFPESSLFRPNQKFHFTAVAFSPSGQQIVTSENSGPFRIWDINTGKNLFSFADASAYAQLAASPDGNHLIGRGSYVMTAWNVHTGKQVWSRGSNP